MIKTYARLLRVHQWTKNLFLFAPTFFAQHLVSATESLKLVLGFLAFSFCASTIYIINDARDVAEDKLHPKKKFRPIASGEISLNAAYLTAAALLILAITLGIYLSVGFFSVMMAYFVMNSLYSIKLKQIPLLDISIISFGFLLRVFAGGELLDIEISKWLILMTFLLAMLLALGKRKDDVLILKESGQSMRKSIKGYTLEFINYSIVLMASITIVAYLMYTVSDEVVARLHSEYVYLTSIFVILGILRYMQIVFVEENSGFPTEILLKDRFVQLVLLAWIGSFVAMLYF